MKNRLKRFFRKVKVGFKKIWYHHKFKIIIALLILSFLIAYLWRNIFISIYPGHAGVMWKRFSGGTVTTKIYREGLHIIFPWDKMYDYSLRIQEGHKEMRILTSNGLYIEIDFSYRFYLERKGFKPEASYIPTKLESEDLAHLPILHIKWGPHYVRKFVSPEAKAAAIAILGDTDPKDLYSLRTTKIQKDIKDLLSKEFKESYIVLHDFLITRLELPETIKSAIERKLTQEQLLEEYDFRVEVAKKERERKQIEAMGITLFREISGIDILKWRGLEVTSEIAQSRNTKVVIVGTSQDGLPVILNADK